MGGGQQAKYLIRMEVYDCIKEGATEKIAAMGPKAVPALRRIIERGEYWEKHIAIVALGNIDCAEAKRVLKNALGNEEMGIRIEAMRALEKKDMKGLDEALLGIAEMDSCWNVRRVAERVMIRRSMVPPPEIGSRKIQGNFGNKRVGKGAC
jgi:hypothetical protein